MTDVQQYKEIVIIVSEEKIYFRHAGTKAPIEYNKNKTKLESSVARALQRVLRTYKFGNSTDKIFDNEDYKLLGQLLCQILIGETLQGFIHMALYDIIDTEKKTLKIRCRIYLEFATGIDEELALLPWEYIWAELKDIEGSFLAADLEGQFDLIRRTKENVSLFKPDIASKILIIFVVVKLDKLPVEPLEKLKETLNGENFIIREITNPTLSTFGKMLDKILDEEKNRNGFIIHYYGHAKVEDERGQISFMDKDQNDHDWISDVQFADYFQSPGRRPHLFFLQACSSGQIVKYTSNEKRGIALLLSLKEIPAVVAMQNDVNVLDSFAFVDIFYADILNGKDVAEAVTKGRQYLGSKYLEENAQNKYSTNAFGTPILFISTEEPIRMINKIEKPVPLSVEPEDIKETLTVEKTDSSKAQNEARKPSENVYEEKAEKPKENTVNDLTKPERANTEIKSAI